jgi:FMN phosphatase YigB (HAD superfamily)
MCGTCTELLHAPGVAGRKLAPARVSVRELVASAHRHASPTVSTVGVLLVDLDDTLIPDQTARDDAMRETLATCGTSLALSAVWPVVREEWRASGLRSIPALVGVSSWEALWTDFSAALVGRAARDVGHAYQASVWQRLLPFEDVSVVIAAFRSAREKRVSTFAWVPEALTTWAASHDLWCVTNGSSWLQRRKLLLAGLEPRFTEVVISGDLGAEKSDLRFRDEVAVRLRRSGLVAVGVIGDSDASDGALASFLGVRHLPVQPGARPTAAWLEPS